ncbi:hypothetical protein N752_20435 [Desulforamulus aquiferis]|nr:hypothetical protein N752_20435 [Desulforamulus aquiferis]
MIRDGHKVGLTHVQDLRHDQMPDPVADMLSQMQGAVEKLESRLKEVEEECCKLKEHGEGAKENSGNI